MNRVTLTDQIGAVPNTNFSPWYLSNITAVQNNKPYSWIGVTDSPNYKMIRKHKYLKLV